MTKAELFRSHISGLELGEDVKTDILTKFDVVDTGYKETNKSIDDSRALFKNKLKASEDNNLLFKSTLGLDADINEDSIKEALKGLKNTDAVDAKNKEDMQKLRDLIQEKDTTISNNQLRFEDINFNNAIAKVGTMKKVEDLESARNYISGLIKNQTIFKDGNLYQKDSETGQIATDLMGKVIGIDEVVKNILNDPLNNIYLKKEIQGNGGNAQQSTTSTTIGRQQIGNRLF